MVMLIQRGDPEIAGALMAGVMAGRAGATGRGTTSSVTADAVTPSTEGEGFWRGGGQAVESVEIVTAEADKWRRVARQVHIAVGRNLTAEDYRLMIVKARRKYATHRRTGPAYTVAWKLLLAWVMLCQAIRMAYRAQDRVLR